MPEYSYLDAFDVKDMGPVAQEVFSRSKEFNGKKLVLVGDKLHPQEYVIRMALITKRPTKAILITPKEYELQGGKKVVADMFRYFTKYGFYSGRRGIPGKKYFPLKTWEQYLQAEVNALESH